MGVNTAGAQLMTSGKMKRLIIRFIGPPNQDGKAFLYEGEIITYQKLGIASR
jgi:hypothetical protein